ncbi:DUF4179 domain-containing protein [Paenibacillus sp. N3.4]|uniref:DUF4179 domain-containing protein n=1 Tax=Paenibacillus sp. N3.4 TaxID=2603222 RepID=UPI0011CC4803|nr:DUF4179 domain-containing protein [Paenibacillus sp. N3.4]TXK76055.1 DUF4179 domain-containing protein [Paenibacillus sp. N3.4]
MSIYKELNDVNINLSEYMEDELTSVQIRKWNSRVIKKIRKTKQSRSMKYAGAASIVILAISIAISSDQVSFAKIPLVGGVIEKALERAGFRVQADFTPYKTKLDSTVENEYGKLTLGEVMIDGDQLLINTNYIPADENNLDLDPTPYPKEIRMNGKDLGLTPVMTGGFRSFMDRSLIIYTVEIKEIPIGKSIHFHISFNYGDRQKTIDHPWVFDFNVPTQQLEKDSKTIKIDQVMKYDDEHSVLIKSMIATPISTTVHYQAEAGFIPQLETASGVEIKSVSRLSASTMKSESWIRYSPLDLKSEKYYFVPPKGSDSPRILINP